MYPENSTDNTADSTAEPEGPIAEVAWQRWPDALRTRGQQVLAALESGHPPTALELLDELLADLMARRDSVAESTNRRFEPTTDER